MSGGGGQPAGDTTTTVLPPNYILPYIGTGANQAASLLQHGGPGYYPGQTVAGFSQPQQQAMNSTFNLGMSGTPGLSAAQGYDTGMLMSGGGSSPGLNAAQGYDTGMLMSGGGSSPGLNAAQGYDTGMLMSGGGSSPGLNAAQAFNQTLLNGGGTNPYEDAMFNRAATASQNQLASEFAGAGRNVGMSQPERMQQLNDLATNIYGGNYQANMQNALQAGNQATNIYNSRAQNALNAGNQATNIYNSRAQNALNAGNQATNIYNSRAQNAFNAGNQAQGLYGTQMQGLNAAMGVGAQVQNQAQNLINADMARYNANQTQPYQNLSGYLSYLQQMQPGSQTSSPYFTNPLGNAAGGALIGAALGGNGGPLSSLGSGWGSLIGAGVGLLGG